MTSDIALPQLAAIATNDRATPSLVYRSLLQKHPRRADGARRQASQRARAGAAAQHQPHRGAQRAGDDGAAGPGARGASAAAPILTDDADLVFDRMDQTSIGSHEAVPSFAEIVEGRLLFEPAMMHLVVSRVQDEEIAEMRRILEQILVGADLGGLQGADLRAAPADLRQHQEQVPDADHGQHPRRSPRRAVRRPRHRQAGARRRCASRPTRISRPSSTPSMQRNGKRAEELVADHLMRTLATINIWQ